MKNMFNLRLYLEGLKKLKLIGIAASIVCVGLSALVPTVYMVSNAKYLSVPKQMSEYAVGINMFSAPLCLILFFAPFFVKSVFSYLNHRNESDFYHSIPYKRVTVFNSFMLAAFTWVLAVISVTVLACAFLWGIIPWVEYQFLTVGALILSYFFACALLMCFMALAMSLTGTATSNLFVFILLASFLRIIFSLFLRSTDMILPIWSPGETIGKITELKFYFPFAILGGLISLVSTTDAFLNLYLYLYSFLASALLYVCAAKLYSVRRSEMAGKSAPNNFLQHIYRIAFTTPFTLLFATVLLFDIYNVSSVSVGIYVVLIAITVIVYYLYELITTKSLKKAFKATPYLAALAVIAGVYIGALCGLRAIVLSTTPDADEIYSVVIVDKSNRSISYEQYACKNVEIKDPEVIEYVSNALKQSVKTVEENIYSVSYSYSYKYDYKTVRIKLKSGRTITRNIKFYSYDYSDILNIARRSGEYGDAYLSVPSPSSLNYGNSEITARKKEIYNCFYEEYNLLSREDKIKAKTEPAYHTFTYSGREGFTDYEFHMHLSRYTPKTLQYYRDMMGEESVLYYYEAGDSSVSEYLKQYDAMWVALKMFCEDDIALLKNRTRNFRIDILLQQDNAGVEFSTYYDSYKTQKGRDICVNTIDILKKYAKTEYESGDWVINIDVKYAYPDKIEEMDGEIKKRTYQISASNIIFVDPKDGEHILTYMGMLNRATNNQGSEIIYD